MPNKYEKDILELELGLETPCELHHRGFSRAINYISCNVGHTGQYKYSFHIPICQECQDALADPNWVLMYCLKCTDNRWRYTPLARLNYYGKHILWTSCCPSCREQDEKVNIFFND